MHRDKASQFQPKRRDFFFLFHGSQIYAKNLKIAHGNEYCEN